MNHHSILLGAALAAAITASLVSGCGRNNPNNRPSQSSNSDSIVGSPTSPGSQPATLADQNTPRGQFLRIAADTSTEKLNQTDLDFLKEAAAGGQFEVEAGKLGGKMASDAGIKSFAQMLVTDHTKANNELKQLAGSKRVEVSEQLPASMRGDLDKLGKASGKDFDREFIKQVGIEDHEKNIKLFEKASKNGKDPEVRAWAEKTLPNLRQHLAEARRLASSTR